MTPRIFAFVTVAVFLQGIAIAQEAQPRKLRILLVADGPMRTDRRHHAPRDETHHGERDVYDTCAPPYVLSRVAISS